MILFGIKERRLDETICCGEKKKQMSASLSSSLLLPPLLPLFSSLHSLFPSSFFCLERNLQSFKVRTLQVPLSYEVLYTSNYFLLFSNWNSIQQEYLSTDLKKKEEGKGRKKGKDGRKEKGKGRV